jgi:hypothetical protein
VYSCGWPKAGFWLIFAIKLSITSAIHFAPTRKR